MNEHSPTYTTAQAMTVLGLSRSAFHHLRNQFPQAFIVIKHGSGRNNPTLYHKAAIDILVKYRQEQKDRSVFFSQLADMFNSNWKE